MSKILTITVQGEDAEDPANVLELIANQVTEGFTSGFDRNETSSYEYVVSEEKQ